MRASSVTDKRTLLHLVRRLDHLEILVLRHHPIVTHLTLLGHVSLSLKLALLLVRSGTSFMTFLLAWVVDDQSGQILGLLQLPCLQVDDFTRLFFIVALVVDVAQLALLAVSLTDR